VADLDRVARADTAAPIAEARRMPGLSPTNAARFAARRRTMNDPRQTKKSGNPTARIAAFIVVILLFVIGTLVYNALESKRDYDRTMGPAADESPAASAAAAVAASGASQ
jgi:hypothetical protein